MSEANVPFNPEGQPESVDSPYSIWDEPTAEMIERADAADAKLNLEIDQIFDTSDLDKFAAAELSATGAEDQTSSPGQSVASVSTNLSSIAAWSQNVINQIDPPNLNDLVSLIQELNQCNGVLMERVTQLEEALEYSQSALQAEVGRTQDVQTADTAQDWTTVQEQVTSLFNQLEFAHQTNQRQQILIETLTAQLENSQERAAQLEREAALIQQHYNEQTQLLAKSEGTCRDLQSRLQRQQRYTLQFKAALEKCLEVPSPQYETSSILPEPATALVEALTEASFLPKAQRIQPWSAQAHSSPKSPWMKLQHLDLPEESEPAADQVAAQINEQPAPVQNPHLNLPSFGLPLLQFSSEDEAAQAAVEQHLSEQVRRLTHEPALKHQLDAAVKPLADMLAEALLADQSEVASETAASETATQPDASETAAEELLASTMADAEDALWQDLARLIDVSTEDVIKASLSGDLAAFESIDFTTLQPEAAKPEAVEPDQPQVAESSEDAAAVAPLVRRMSGSAPAVNLPQSPEAIPALTSPSWPSPVVYPLRPTRKRQSLAMVDLPSFPRS